MDDTVRTESGQTDGRDEMLAALAAAAGLHLDAQRLAHLGRQWVRLMDGLKLLEELHLGDAQPAAFLPQREERADER